MPDSSSSLRAPFGGSLVDGFLIWRTNTLALRPRVSVANRSGAIGPATGTRRIQSMCISSGKRSSPILPSPPPPTFSLIYTRYTDALRERVPRGTCNVYTRVNDRGYTLPPVCVCARVCVPGTALLSLPLPFRELRALRRPGCRAATVTTNDGSLCWRGSLLVGVRRACVGPPPVRTPANRRQISPGRLDACLRCLSSVPLILNRIQRTKPVTTRPPHGGRPMCT